MAAINSRQKGASSERELAGLLHDHLGIKLTRCLDQCRGGGFDLAVTSEASGPVADALRGLALECKRYGAITPGLLSRFWAQAVRQAEAAGLIPVLAYRADRHPWRIVVPLGWLRPDCGDNLALEYAAELSVPAFCLAIRESIIEESSHAAK